MGGEGTGGGGWEREMECKTNLHHATLSGDIHDTQCNTVYRISNQFITLSRAYVPATTSATTNSSCPPSREGKGREFSTAKLMLRDAMKPEKYARM